MITRSYFRFFKDVFHGIKINKEIRGYKETIFFGLPFRQFACSVLAVGAVALYFGLKDVLGREIIS